MSNELGGQSENKVASSEEFPVQAVIYGLLNIVVISGFSAVILGSEPDLRSTLLAVAFAILSGVAIAIRRARIIKREGEDGEG